MAAITLKDIVKQYGDGFLAVKGVSLDIADGEFVILVGPSGCGKSTLLRMIVGLEDITAGDLTIGGKRVNDKAPRDRHLAMVFQNYALYPHLTVFENIAFPLRLQKGQFTEAQIREKVEFAAKTLELQDHLDRKPANLSGGQRQRVAMGRAIVREARGVPVRRAAVQPRRQAARPDAHRDRPHAAPPRHHHRLRHARPDRGHDPRRPGRGAAQGRAAAGRQPARPVRAAGEPVRRRLHRLAAHELPAGRGRRVARMQLPFADVPISADLAPKLRRQGPRHRRHPPRALRGRRLLEDGARRRRRRRSPRPWTSPSGSARSSTPTSRSTRTRTSRSTLEELDRDLDGEGLRTQLIVALDSETQDPRRRRRDPLVRPRPDAWCSTPRPARTSPGTPTAAETIDQENEADRKASLERAQAREKARADRLGRRRGRGRVAQRELGRELAAAGWRPRARP